MTAYEPPTWTGALLLLIVGGGIAALFGLVIAVLLA